MLSGKHSVNSFHQLINPPALPKLEDPGAPVHFERFQGSISISSVRTHSPLGGGGGGSQAPCVNEIRDVVDVNQTDTFKEQTGFQKQRPMSHVLLHQKINWSMTRWEKVHLQNSKCFTLTFSTHVVFVVLRRSQACAPDHWSWDLFLLTLKSHLPCNVTKSFCCPCICPRQIGGWCCLLTFRLWRSLLFSG